jgi:hypothetical protein
MIEKKKKKINPNNPNQTENQWGRPLKYTPEELYEKAQEYFQKCDETIISFDKVNLKTITKPKTLSWLCLWLKVSKDYISEKAKSKEFSETIKEIRLVVENNIEEWILQWSYNPTSWIFNLKNNFDWKDKSEVDNNNINIDVSDTLNETQKSLIAQRYGNK